MAVDELKKEKDTLKSLSFCLRAQIILDAFYAEITNKLKALSSYLSNHSVIWF